MATQNAIADIVCTARLLKEPQRRAQKEAIASAKQAHSKTFDRLNGNGDCVAARSVD